MEEIVRGGIESSVLSLLAAYYRYINIILFCSGMEVEEDG